MKKQIQKSAQSKFQQFENQKIEQPLLKKVKGGEEVDYIITEDVING